MGHTDGKHRCLLTKCTDGKFGWHIQCQVGISVLYRGVGANHRNRLKLSFSK